MAKDMKYGLKDLRANFPDDDACLDFLFETLHSRECSCGGQYTRLKNRPQYQCSLCRFQISPKAGTIFHKSATPLTLWFHAIWIFSNAKSGISAKEMERQLGVTYKTAWRILHLIRKSLKQNATPLNGQVEVDEAHFGGKGDGGTYNENASEVMKKKGKVIAGVERKGQIVAKHVDDLSAETIGEFLDEHIIAGDSTLLITDKSNRYDKVAEHYNRESVNHSQGEYVRGDIHVNNVETFWSHVKRSTKGTYKSISKKHLQSYLDQFVWHYNNRHNDRKRFSSLLTRVVG